jgi:hypothetical protein
LQRVCIEPRLRVVVFRGTLNFTSMMMVFSAQSLVLPRTDDHWAIYQYDLVSLHLIYGRQGDLNVIFQVGCRPVFGFKASIIIGVPQTKRTRSVFCQQESIRLNRFKRVVTYGGAAFCKLAQRHQRQRHGRRAVAKIWADKQ